MLFCNASVIKYAFYFFELSNYTTDNVDNFDNTQSIFKTICIEYYFHKLRYQYIYPIL